MSDDSLRILLLGDSRSVHIERLVEQFRQQGCHTLLASLERGTVHHFHLKRKSGFIRFHYLLAAGEIRSLIRRFIPDVVNAHYASGYGFTAAHAVRNTTIPLLLNLWGSDILQVPKVSRAHYHKARYALRKADFVCGDSQYLIEEAKKISEFSHAEVIPWGIEKKYITLHRKSYDITPPLKIIVPRAHEPVYNNTFILQSLAPLINDGLINITFPAFGSLVDDFRQESKELEGDVVTLYPRKTRADFLQYMANHDIVLSNAISDSSPVSIIEAMALGLIPVAADIPGIREWLTPDSGFIYRPGDADQIRHIMKNLVNSQQSYSEMRQRNLEKVKQQGIFEDNIVTLIGIMRFLAGR